MHTLCYTITKFYLEVGSIPLIYKINVLKALKANGYSTYALRNKMDKKKKLSESTLQRLRENRGVSWENLEKICALLECDIGDIIAYIPDTPGKNKEKMPYGDSIAGG